MSVAHHSPLILLEKPDPQRHGEEGSPVVAYSVIGWFAAPPQIGSSVIVFRICRCGLWVDGIFVSSPVVALSDRGFHTLNSVYRWQEVRCPTVLADVAVRLSRS
jgi:hypothetical protein